MATSDGSGDGGGGASAPSTREEVLEFYQNHPVAWVEEEAGMTLGDTQKAPLEAIQRGENQILIVSGNGTGKTVGATAAAAWHFNVFWNSFTMITSGNYDVLTDSSWRDLKDMRRRFTQGPWAAKKKETPPTLEKPGYDKWFLRYISPVYPENLQGRHARRSMVIIEEADKPDITKEHIDSAGTTGTDTTDIKIVLANPPQSKSNVVYDLMEDDAWHTIQFSSFDSHNVKREMGRLPEDDGRGEIPGLIDLDLIREDWEKWNRRPWPGAKAAARSHPDFHPEDSPEAERWENLDPRWYRIRLGKMSPTGSGTLRPFYEADVEAALDRWEDWMAEEQTRVALSDVEGADDGAEVISDDDRHLRAGIGMDVARGGGDRSVIVERRVDGVLNIFTECQPDEHGVNDRLIDAAVAAGGLDGWFYIDALGEGSAVADRAKRKYSGAKRFTASEEAADSTEYYNRRTEAFYQLGEKLRDGELAVPPNSSLERELRAASRVLELEERHLREATVLQLKGKEDLKEQRNLGRSPDVLDAAALACYEPRQRSEYDDRMGHIGGMAG